MCKNIEVFYQMFGKFHWQIQKIKKGKKCGCALAASAFNSLNQDLFSLQSASGMMCSCLSTSCSLLNCTQRTCHVFAYAEVPAQPAWLSAEELKCFVYSCHDPFDVS